MADDFLIMKRIVFTFVLLILLFVHCFTGYAFEVTKIQFKGIQSFQESELRDLLHSEEGDEFDARLVKLDKIVLTNFYRSKGFLTVEIYDSLNIRRPEKEVYILYQIIEGQRFYLGEIKINGNHEVSSSALLNLFNDYKPPATFDEAIIDQTRNKIEDLYYNKGKPFVDINLDYEFSQDSLVIVKIDLTENQTVYIKDIEYLGIRNVQKFIIRRELEFQKGDMYNRKKLTKSQQNIYSTGLFDYVRFEIAPLVGDSVNVNLKIIVQERDPRWVGMRVGFAYEQEESYGNKLELAAEGGHRNLFGTARSISLHLVPSFLYDVESNKIVNPENQITFNFIEPWIGYTRTPGVLQLSYHQYRPLNSADFNVFRSAFNVKHSFEDFIELSGGIEAKFVSLLSEGFIDTTLDVDAGKDQVYSLSFYGRRDSKNNFFNPTNGSLTDLSVIFSYSIGQTSTGAEDVKKYFTLVSSWQRYQPIRFNLFNEKYRVTLASRIKGGAIIELGGTKDIAISDLFFAGGATTVRGYEEQLLGPSIKDEEGFVSKARGGKLLLLANAEIRIPIYWLFVGELFVDAGNVWREIKQFSPPQIKFTTGAGLALLTPIGPIRFDYGVKLMKEPSDRQASVFHLGFYFAF
jgi:outer membrane protein insertion porin family